MSDLIAAGSDFIVLTGFLGSGKTTLLADFLRLPEAANTAVIVNEAGEIGLDGAILAENGDPPVLQLANGCVCCSLGPDLAGTVTSLLAARQRAGQPPPARLVLETSGLAKPGPILRSLANLAPLRLRVSVVATFDCSRGGALDGIEEAAAQWAGAQTLVITRRDLASEVQRDNAGRAAAGINPTAQVIDTDDRRAAVLASFSPRATAPHSLFPPAEAVGLQHPRIRVLLASFAQPVAWDDLAEWLDNLAGLCGERLLRLKGLVRVAGRAQPILVQSVGTMFSAPRPFAAAAEQSFVVLILRDMDPDEIATVHPSLPIRVVVLGRH
jgi:G3E family GTPase